VIGSSSLCDGYRPPIDFRFLTDQLAALVMSAPARAWIDGTVEAPFSPMRARWAEEAAAAAKGAPE
jgi:hypothetical protein